MNSPVVSNVFIGLTLSLSINTRNVFQVFLSVFLSGFPVYRKNQSVSALSFRILVPWLGFIIPQSSRFVNIVLTFSTKIFFPNVFSLLFQHIHYFRLIFRFVMLQSSSVSIPMTKAPNNSTAITATALCGLNFLSWRK